MILPRHLTPFASTMHERDDLVVLQFIHVSILRCNSFLYQFPCLQFIHVRALASSPAVGGYESKILVPAESTTKTQFAALKQAVSHSEHGRCCEHHPLVVAHVYDHGHRPALVGSGTTLISHACATAAGDAARTGSRLRSGSPEAALPMRFGIRADPAIIDANSRRPSNSIRGPSALPRRPVRSVCCARRERPRRSRAAE